MESFEILCGIAVLLAVYYYLISTYDFWKSRGIRGPQPILGFGNLKDVILNKKFVGEYLMETYNEYKDEPMIGIFIGKTPVLLVKDPDLIKNILIKDFSKFANRRIVVNDNSDSLSQNLVTLEYKKWRPLRTRLSPVFTSGKLKEMFILISECADHLEQYMEKLVSKNEPIECRELTAKYTTDVIGTCAFGIEINALSDEDSEFRKMGRLIFAPNWINTLRIRFRQLPRLSYILSYILPYTEVDKFFLRIVAETMHYREINNVIRHDFIDILRELKKNPDKLGDINLTESLIASQAFIFFAAGFETSSTTMSHALYELALNQQIQDKLRKEIDEGYTKHSSNLTYENIKKLNYLNKVFKETLRKYPPVTILMRQSMSNYTFDGIKKLSIPKNQKVWIPTLAIHRDPDIYPKPDVFDPERFTEEAVQARHAMYYLPFGDGPRNCIAARFAVYQTKIGLIKILRNYKVETCDKTQIPYVIDPKAFLLAPKGGIHLRIIKINQP